MRYKYNALQRGKKHAFRKNYTQRAGTAKL